MMSMQINAYANAIRNTIKPESKPAPAAKGQFGALIQQYVEQTNIQEKVAGKASVELATGKSHNVSETMLALQKADLSFQLMLSVRNKLVDAYREVMRMQV